MRNKSDDERLTVLEITNQFKKETINDLVERLEKLEEKLSNYDKMAAKWGGMMIATITIFSLIGMTWEKLGAKIIDWVSK